MELSRERLSAMISLLDDTDQDIISSITGDFLRMGLPIIPQLEEFWGDVKNDLIQNRLENIIHNIQYEDVCEKLTAWVKAADHNLLEGALIIARYRYPDMDENWVRMQIESLRIEAWLEMRFEQTSMEKIRLLNHIFFRVHGFAGNTENYQEASNSFINQVLEKKKGNPLLLCVLYMMIAQKLGMPVYGVNLPQHFILCYLDDSLEAMQRPVNEREVLFYINPFNKGMIFGRREIDQFLNLLKMDKEERFYHPCSNLDIIARMLNNLISSYVEQNKQETVEELVRLRGIVTGFSDDSAI